MLTIVCIPFPHAWLLPAHPHTTTLHSKMSRMGGTPFFLMKRPLTKVTAFHSSTGNLCGIPSDLIVEDLVEGNKVEIDSIVTSLKQMKRKIKDFQKGNEVTFENLEQLDDDVMSSHILIFEQIKGEGERMTSFLCNKGENDNFEILNGLCHSTQDPKFSAK